MSTICQKHFSGFSVFSGFDFPNISQYFNFQRWLFFESCFQRFQRFFDFCVLSVFSELGVIFQWFQRFQWFFGPLK